MNRLDDMVNYMFIDLPGCSLGNMKQELYRAARDFCVETESFIVELTAISIVSGTSDYDLNAGYDCEIQRIRNAVINETSGDRTTGSMTADQYDLVDEFTFHFVDAPTKNQTSALKIDLALRPIFGNAPDLPDWYWNRWGEGIVSYGKFRLMSQSRKPWTDPSLASLHQRIYSQYRARALKENSMEYKYGDLNAEIPMFV